MTTPPTTPPTTEKVPRRVLGATLIGTVVEWYDFSIYGFTAVVLARHFFPEGSGSVLDVYATFVLAYAVRPVAGAALGWLADRVGRRSVLALTIFGMGAATFVTGMVPGYETIGILAPILVVLMRLVQGFSASGEWTAGAIFLLEQSPRSRWNRMCAYINMSYYLSLLLGTGLATLLAFALGDQAFNEWGWRILFLAAAPLGLIGVYIRRRTTETAAFVETRRRQAAEEEARPAFWRTVRDQWRELLAYSGMKAQHRAAQFALSAFVTTALIRAGLSTSSAFLVTFLSYVVSIPLVWTGGYLADRYGLRPVLLSGMALLTLSSVPIFLAINTGSFVLALVAALVLSVGVTIPTAAELTLMIGMFAVRIRGIATGITYNLNTVLFGSTAPVIATWLSDRTGTNTAYGWYATALGLVSVPCLLYCLRRLRAVQAGGES